VEKKNDSWADQPVPKLACWMKWINIANAALLVAVGVVAFVTITLNLLVILCALYVIAFAGLLICFETHLGCVEQYVYRDCGFMFRWQGRAIFLVFVGTLSFTLDTFGIIGGAVTMANVIFNLYVVKVNPGYMAYLQKRGEEERAKNQDVDNALLAMRTVKKAHDAGVISADRQGNITVNAGAAANAYVNSPAAPAASGQAADPNNDGWEKIFDEGSGTYYFYNPVTKQTRWA